MMRQIIQLGARLMLFALAAGLLLGATDAITRERIAMQEGLAADAARGEVLPAASFEAVYDDAVEPDTSWPEGIHQIHRGIGEDGGFAGIAVLLEVKGYGGAMSLMVGVDASGAVSGMRLLSHAETPGLGAKAAEGGFGDRFAGQSGPTITVLKAGTSGEGIQAISGATITTRAVTGGIERALEIFHVIQAGEGAA